MYYRKKDKFYEFSEHWGEVKWNIREQNHCNLHVSTIEQENFLGGINRDLKLMWKNRN